MSTGTLSLRKLTASPARLLAELHRDVVFGLRLIARSPGFSAIGATTPDIVRLIVGSTAKLAAIGLAIGLSAGGLGAVLLGGFIFGISPTDPLTLAGVAVLVMCTTVLASALPAVRAAQADPLVALRSSR